MSTDDELFTPSEILGGFSAKRARLLLFQLEGRTASLMLQSRRAVERYLTEETAQQENVAFFEALAEGREPPVRPTIRDLERFAPHWQSLVPQNTTLRAALAHSLGQKYRFAQRDIPHIREALGLDSEGVQQAFQRQYHQPLDTIYIRRVSLLERIGWRWNRLGGWLENLPPFWTAYALTYLGLSGRAATQASVRLGYADAEQVYEAASGVIPHFPALRSATFHLPATKAQELQVWVHRVTAEGHSENLPVLLKVRMGKDIQDVHLEGASRQVVLPLGDVGKKTSKRSPVEAGQLEVEVQLAENTTR